MNDASKRNLTILFFVSAAIILMAFVFNYNAILTFVQDGDFELFVRLISFIAVSYTLLLLSVSVLKYLDPSFKHRIFNENTGGILGRSLFLVEEASERILSYQNREQEKNASQFTVVIEHKNHPVKQPEEIQKSNDELAIIEIRKAIVVMKQNLAYTRRLFNLFFALSLPFLIVNVVYAIYFAYSFKDFSLSMTSFWMFVLPKLSVVIVLQVAFFAFFKIGLKLLNTTQRYQNNITTMEVNLAMMMMCSERKERAVVVHKMFDIDFNNVILKGETTIDIEMAKANNLKREALDMTKELISSLNKTTNPKK